MWEYQGKRWELDLEDYDTAVRFKQALEALSAQEGQLKESLEAGDAVFRGPEGIRAYAEMFHRVFAGLFGQEAVDSLFEGRCNIRECDEAYLSLMEYLRGQMEAARVRKERFMAYLPRSGREGSGMQAQESRG